MTEPMEQKWHRYTWSIVNEDGNGMETATGELDADMLDRIVADHNFALHREDIVRFIRGVVPLDTDDPRIKHDIIAKLEALDGE